VIAVYIRYIERKIGLNPAKSASVSKGDDIRSMKCGIQSANSNNKN
jgi:hypothetical protein